MDTKKCIECGLIKPLDEYPWRTSAKWEYRDDCKQCAYKRSGAYTIARRRTYRTRPDVIVRQREYIRAYDQLPPVEQQKADIERERRRRIEVDKQIVSETKQMVTRSRVTEDRETKKAEMRQRLASMGITNIIGETH